MDFCRIHTRGLRCRTDKTRFRIGPGRSRKRWCELKQTQDRKPCAWPGCTRETTAKHCDPHAVMSHANAQKKYADRNRTKIRHKNKIYQRAISPQRRQRYADIKPIYVSDRGRALTIHGWRITETTYSVLAERFGHHWAEAYCAQLAERERKAAV